MSRIRRSLLVFFALFLVLVPAQAFAGWCPLFGCHIYEHNLTEEFCDCVLVGVSDGMTEKRCRVVTKTRIIRILELWIPFTTCHCELYDLCTGAV